jgi:hypothetical protein
MDPALPGADIPAAPLADVPATPLEMFPATPLERLPPKPVASPQKNWSGPWQAVTAQPSHAVAMAPRSNDRRCWARSMSAVASYSLIRAARSH